ncbi:glycosyltransferase family 4 protein [soil metagenome]
MDSSDKATETNQTLPGQDQWDHSVGGVRSGGKGSGGMRRRALLAAVGDASHPDTFSGISSHFLAAAVAEGVLNGGLSLTTDGPRWQLRRWSWNLKAVLLGDRSGGYQFSVPFLEALWAPHQHLLRGALLMNVFQLYPPSVVGDPSIEKWFFIDQPLLALFDDYGTRASIGRRVARESLERERQGYHAAAGVIAHSRWAANSLIDDYGVPSDKVHVVVPGANLDPESYGEWERAEIRRRETSASLTGKDSIRFVFVGKDWKRKGLDRLLRGLALARRQGADVTLRVIGCPREALPSELRDTSGIEWCGFINKREDPKRFLRLVAECDVGCLLSRAEAGGISLREYHALGLAVFGTTAGGAPEHADPEASWLLGADAANDTST